MDLQDFRLKIAAALSYKYNLKFEKSNGGFKNRGFLLNGH